MSKLATIALIGVAVVLVLSGVVDIGVHPDKLPQVPKALTSSVEDRGLYERARSYTVRAKRFGELFFVSNESNKIQLVLEYVEVDSDRVQQLILDDKSAKTLIPQIELLVDSLERAKKESREASPEVLAANKDRSIISIQQAAKTFEQLKVVQEKAENDQDQLAGVTESLQQEVDLLASYVQDDGDGAVAGAEDQNDEEEGSSKEESGEDADASIPLSF